MVSTLCESFTAALNAEDHGRAAAYLSRALREPLEPRERARLTLELAAAEAMSAPLAGDRRLGELVRGGSGAPKDCAPAPSTSDSPAATATGHAARRPRRCATSGPANATA